MNFICVTQNRGEGGSSEHCIERFEFRRKRRFSSLGKLPSTALCAVSMLAMKCIIMIIYVYAVELHVQFYGLKFQILFVVSLMTLLVAMQPVTAGLQGICNWKLYGRKHSWFNLGYRLGVFMEGLRKQLQKLKEIAVRVAVRQLLDTSEEPCFMGQFVLWDVLRNNILTTENSDF